MSLLCTAGFGRQDAGLREEARARLFQSSAQLTFPADGEAAPAAHTDSSGSLPTLALPGPDWKCLAYSRLSDECKLTLEEFNRYAASLRPNLDAVPDPAGMVREMRGLVLRTLLADKFQEEMHLMLPDRRSRGGESSGGRMLLPDKEARRVYQTLYPEHFAPRTIRPLQVILASDSALAGSWARRAREEAARDSATRVRVASALPWVQSHPEELHPSLAPLLDTLAPGRIHGPLRLPFAWLVVKPGRPHRLPEVPFETALPAIRAWAHSLGLEHGDLDARLQREFQSDRRLWIRPDTLHFLVRLQPAHPASPVPMPALSPIRTTHLELPREVRAKVQDSLRGRSATALGPWILRYGVWAFDSLTLRRGGAGMDFAAARGRILDARIPPGFFDRQNLVTLAQKEADADRSAKRRAAEQALAADTSGLQAIERELAVASSPGVADTAIRIYARTRAAERRREALVEDWIAKHLVLTGLP